MRAFSLLSAALFVGANALPAQSGTVIFEDDFDNENAPSNDFVRNYTDFASFEVVRGGVDLIGNGRFDFLPGNGLYLDMDGSDGIGGGTLRFNADLDGLAGPLEVSFDLAGSQRKNGGVSVSLSGETTRYDFKRNDGFETFTLRTESAENFELSFVQGGSDGVGVLLDNIVITSFADFGGGSGNGNGAGGGGGDNGGGSGTADGDADTGGDGSDSGGASAAEEAAAGAVSVPVPGAAAAGVLLLGGLAARRRRND